jgi:hypothetical protein
MSVSQEESPSKSPSDLVGEDVKKLNLEMPCTGLESASMQRISGRIDWMCYMPSAKWKSPKKGAIKR